MDTMSNRRQKRSRPSRAHGLGLILLGLGLGLSASLAMAEIPEEDRVKAAVIVKLTRFVEWPTDALPEGADLNLCLFGELPVTEALLEIRDQTVRQHALKMHKRSFSDANLSACQAIFIDASEVARMGQALQAVSGRAVLTISELPDFARRGGMIELVKENNHLGFRIHQDRAKKLGFIISSQLLGLAKIVE